jgi:hypothetical protein
MEFRLLQENPEFEAARVELENLNKNSERQLIIFFLLLKLLCLDNKGAVSPEKPYGWT